MEWENRIYKIILDGNTTEIIPIDYQVVDEFPDGRLDGTLGYIATGGYVYIKFADIKNTDLTYYDTFYGFIKKREWDDKLIDYIKKI